MRRCPVAQTVSLAEFESANVEQIDGHEAISCPPPRSNPDARTMVRRPDLVVPIDVEHCSASTAVSCCTRIPMTEERQGAKARDPQGSHSGMDGTSTRAATDRRAGCRLFGKGGAAPPAAAQPPQPVSSNDELGAAADRETVTYPGSSSGAMEKMRIAALAGTLSDWTDPDPGIVTIS
jgi:hypothetical protein